MTTTKLVAYRLSPLGGTNGKGWKDGIIVSGAKAAQNDTWTVTNAKEIIHAIPTVDATGATGTFTKSGNVITLTSATTGAHSARIVYR